jgi:hypothetical protein
MKQATPPEAHHRAEQSQPHLHLAAGRNPAPRPHSRARRSLLHPVCTSIATSKPQNVAGNLLQCASSPPTTGNPNSHGEPSPLYLLPSDLDPEAENKSLNRRGMDRSEPSRSILIARFTNSIRPNRYRLIGTSHVALPESNGFQIRFLIQICTESCKFHIFCSVDPKITNLVPLESLGLVQSSSTIKSYILWVKFESISELGSNPR